MEKQIMIFGLGSNANNNTQQQQTTTSKNEREKVENKQTLKD